MKISINIPSYRRAGNVKTLEYIPFAKVWVDEGEYDAYKKGNPDAEIVSCPKGIQGHGVPRVRNYIMDKEFESGADVVAILDDDFTCLERYDIEEGTTFGYNRTRLVTDDILPFLEKYSLMAKELGAKFWGVNCNSDGMAYRHYTPFSTVSYIGGPFQVFLKGNRCRYDENIPLKEDYDMTLQQLNLERVVLRVNAYHYICKQSTNAGGCAALRNREEEERENMMLQKKWGSKIVKFDFTNKGKSKKERVWKDYNPIIKPPIKGI